MSRQTRNIYVTGNSELDRILADIAARLDTIEGIRPDLDSGLFEIDVSKKITTSQPLGGYQRIVSGISITDNTLEVDGTVEISGTAEVVGAIEVYDSGGNLIHKME